MGLPPYRFALPYVGLFTMVALDIVVGAEPSCAFPAISVDARELMPGRVGMNSCLFLGLVFGIGGSVAAVLGGLADRMGNDVAYRVCSWLPIIGLMTVLLPNQRARRHPSRRHGGTGSGVRLHGRDRG